MIKTRRRPMNLFVGGMRSFEANIQKNLKNKNKKLIFFFFFYIFIENDFKRANTPFRKERCLMGRVQSNTQSYVNRFHQFWSKRLTSQRIYSLVFDLYNSDNIKAKTQKKHYSFISYRHKYKNKTNKYSTSKNCSAQKQKI